MKKDTLKLRMGQSSTSNPGTKQIADTQPKAATTETDHLTRSFHVLLRVPAGSQLTLEDGKPTRIHMMAGRKMPLCITGHPDVLGAIALDGTGSAEGKLTLTRSPATPHPMQSITFEAGNWSEAPSLELRVFAPINSHSKLAAGERGSLVRTKSCIMKITLIKSDVAQASAAAEVGEPAEAERLAA